MSATEQLQPPTPKAAGHVLISLDMVGRILNYFGNCPLSQVYELFTGLKAETEASLAAQQQSGGDQAMSSKSGQQSV